MKKISGRSTRSSIRFLATALTSALIFSPVFVLAQTESGYVHDNWSWRNHSQSSDMQNKINALSPTANQSVSIPVLFGVGLNTIFPNFGDPRSGGRTHEGEDLMAVKGTPIVSPTPAVVIRTGVGASEGNYVYTANPGGETFVYMHLDRIGENVVQGTVLATGGLIGYVGNTGNAAGGAAHLHFEIHDTSGIPTNPFPRLTTEFPLSEKISYLNTIFSVTSDQTTLAELLVTNFRTMFTNANSAGISLPVQITNALASIPVGTLPTIIAASNLPAGDMDIGSSGSLVVSLQQYLIRAMTGPFAVSLSKAGATGYFGSITKAALAEFQTAKGITPASGYFGQSSKIYIETHPITTTPLIQTSSTVLLSRNLSVGATGDDVRALQVALNARGYIVAVSGAGSPGGESNYFGLATQAAVIKLQTALGILPNVGFVGALTRGVLARSS